MASGSVGQVGPGKGQAAACPGVRGEIALPLLAVGSSPKFPVYLRNGFWGETDVTTGCDGDTALWELSLGDQGGLLRGGCVEAGASQGKKGNRTNMPVEQAVEGIDVPIRRGRAAWPVTAHRGCFFLNRSIKVPYGPVMVLGHHVPCRGPCLCKRLEMGEI